MFRKPHYVIRRSQHEGASAYDRDLGGDEHVTLFSLHAFQDITQSDDKSTIQTDVGESRFKVNGPVIVHGYSVEVFGGFFGCVYQGLSKFDDNQITVTDVNSDYGHLYPSDFNTNYTTRSNSELDKWNAIKNFTYLNGFNQDPYKSADLGQQEPFATKGVKWSRTNLDKRLMRDSYTKVGKKDFKLEKKSGLVMLPNTDTDFFSINLKNLQTATTSGDEGSGFIDGVWYARVLVWLSWDLNFSG